MKILIVGDFVWPWYQEACAKALEDLGHEVFRFGWKDDFWINVEGKSEPRFISFFHRLQFRFCHGPILYRIKSRLFDYIKKSTPDIIFFYNVRIFAPSVVKKIRNNYPSSMLCQYSNDNPFSESAKKDFWKNYIYSIPYFHVHFAFRESNLKHYEYRGSKNNKLLRAYFIPSEDYPVPDNLIPDFFKCDVVFAGHYEPDGRLEMLEDICKAGYNLNIFGGGWNSIFDSLSEDSPLRDKFPIYPVVGDEYRYAICGAKVALCFLSSLNDDTYTRRNFQIPAMGVAMLSQETVDLQNLYIKNKEACFFNTSKELLSSLDVLINNSIFRKEISIGGYNKVNNSGHSVLARMNDMMNYLESLIKTNENR
jgi:spore maturation protein CgeB